MYVMPALNGVRYHGDFFIACAIGIFFAIVLALLEVMAVFFSTIWTLSTFGLVLVILIPMRVLCFWVLPTFSLLLIAYLFPHVLTIQSWISAAIGAIVLLIVSWTTRDRRH